MRTILLFVLLAASVFGGQAFTTPVSTSITWPVNFPSLQNAYVEIGVDVVGNCTTAFGTNATANFFSVTLGNAATHRFGIGCNAVGTKAVHVSHDNGTTPTQVLSDADMSGITTAVFRQTRDSSNNQKVFEAFRTDGSLIGTVSYIPGNAAGTTQICTTAPCNTPATRPFLLPNGMVRIRWIRGYTGKPSSYGVLVPKDSFAAIGDLFNFNLEGTLADTSPRALALSNPAASCPGGVLSGCFSPNHAPAGTVVQASASSGSAGGTITLDASQSFRWDDVAPSEYTWQWISGPARPIITTPRAGSTTVTRLVEGTHVFSYSVDGTAPRTLSVVVPSRDSDGMPLYPSNVLTGTTSLSFRLADVPDAVDARITVRKPNGGLLAPVVATSSPVALAIDNRQKNHSYRIEYRDSTGKVLVTSEWQELPVTQVEPGAIYSAGGFNQIAGYLAISPSANPAISKFLGKRYKFSATDDRYMVPFKPVTNPPISLWYIDSRGVYPYDMPKIRKCADDHAFDFERMFLHMDSNYAMDSQPEFSWTRSDMFDLTERSPNDGNQFWNGVIGINPSTNAMVDYTLHAYSSTSRPATCGSTTYCTSGDVATSSSIRTIMFGYLEAFDRLVIDVQTPRSGGTVTWEYSTTGTTWSPLTVTDGTNGLTVDGMVTFTPPVNWKRQLHLATANPNGVAKYWVRVTLSADTTTFPTMNRITGDDWNIWEEEITTGGTGSAYTATSSLSPYVHGRRFKVFPHATTGVPATIAINGGAPKKLLRPDLSYTGVYSVQNGSFAANTSSYIEYDSTLDGGNGAFFVLFKNRGWCDTDTAGSDRITGVDGWEYDPTPGPTCSARFKYQARMQFGWGADHTVSNLGDIQKGIRTRAQCILDFSDGILVKSDGTQQFNGIFLDDLSPDQPGTTQIVYPALGSLGPNATGDAKPNVKPIAYTELGPMTKIQELDLMAAFVSDTRVLLKKKHPTFLLGGNAYTRNISKKWDLSLHEWGLYSITARNWRYSPMASVYGIYSNPATPDDAVWSQPDAAIGGVSNASGEGYDWYSGGVGGNGINDFGAPIHSIHTFWDSAPYVSQPSGCTINVNCTGIYWWDRANRGPMNAYTQYLLGATAYTSFLYILGNQAQYYQSDAYRYVSTTPEFALTAPLGATVTDNTTKTLSGNFTNLPSSGGVVKIGDQYLTLTKVNNSTATTVSPVGRAFPAGTPMFLVHTDRLSANPPPPLARIMTWDYFPAQDIDVGVPDTTNGIIGDTVNGVTAKGNRKLFWKTAGAGADPKGGLTNPIARRDFTKAIVLQASGNNAVSAAELDTYSNNLVIQDGNGTKLNLWVLTADGKTPGGLCGPGITTNADGSCPSVKLRNAEGMVLMKQPVR